MRDTTPAPDAKQRTRVLYISPLRALAFDVEKNLRSPLMGIALVITGFLRWLKRRW